MDIQKEREEFEKLPDIKGILYGSDFGFNESLNEYYHPDHTNHRLNYAFIMGAWMAWKAKAQAVPKYNASIDAHQWAIDEIKTEINDGYDLCQDSYLLDALVERGIDIGKIQAVSEGFVLVPKEPYAYLIKHKLWNKNPQPEIYLADDFVGDDGVEREKLIVCIPLYKGEDEAQEQTHE